MVGRGWEAPARAGVETNILCTVNAANEEHGAQVYRYFRDELGARYLQFIPIVERVRAADLAQAERGWRSGTSALLFRLDGGRVGGRAAYVLWFEGIRRLPVTPTALLGLLSPLNAALLGHVIAGEALTSIQFLGFALALTAMSAGQLAPHSSRSSSRKDPS